MADIKISQLTPKGAPIAATDLVEIAEDDGAGGYVAKSVTGANILASGMGGLHILTKPISGRSYNVRRTGTNSGNNFSTSSNTIILYPFIPANTLTVSSLQISVITLTVGGLIRILVYSDLNGVPSSKLLESTSLDCSTSGIKTYTESFTFTAGTTYWLGHYANMTLNSISAVPGSELTSISAYTGGFNAASITVTAAATFPTAPATLGTASPVLSAGLLINLTAA
jgi:hypothetical protein